MIWRGIRLAISVAAVVLGVSACGGGHASPSRSTHLKGGLVVVLTHGFRIYDPTGYTTAGLTGADIVRSSVRTFSSGGVVDVNVRLTRSGQSSLCRLTRALARRGAQLHHQLPFVVAINGREYKRIYVDYKATPNGICGSPVLEFAGLTRPAAQILIKRIRGS